MLLLAEKLDGFMAGFFILIQNDEAKAGPGQAPNNRLTDTTRTASYNGDFICHHVNTFQLIEANGSPHDTSAVHQNRLAGNKRRRITRQKYCRTDQVFRLPDASQWNSLRLRVHLLFCLMA